jgi:hypothetical protein
MIINTMAIKTKAMAVFASEPNIMGIGPIRTTPPPLIDF